MRGFYRINQKGWPIKGPDPEGGRKKVEVQPVDCVVLAETTRYVYLHSARAPNDWLVENVAKANLDFMGTSWVEFWGQLDDSTRNRIFECDHPKKGRVKLREVAKAERSKMRPLVPHAWGAKEGTRDQTALDMVLGS